MNELMNESVNYEAVCRTAPAKTGLEITYLLKALQTSIF